MAGHSPHFVVFTECGVCYTCLFAISEGYLPKVLIKNLDTRKNFNTIAELSC